MSSEQQPVLVYPNTVTSQPSSSHKKESFGTVFIVLAVIVLVSAIACFLGRLCSRRYHHPKAKQSHAAASRPKEREAKQKHTSHAREGDIEFGFDKGIPATVKPFGNGEAKGSKPAGYHNNGEIFKGGPRFAYEGELKAGDYYTA